MNVSTFSQNILIFDNLEPLIDLKKRYPTLVLRKDSLFVRKSVAEKLIKIQSTLKRKDPSLKLIVLEGYKNIVYRGSHLEEQLDRFPSTMAYLSGGTVDVMLRGVDLGGSPDTKGSLDLRTTFSKVLTPSQKENRLLLHDTMVEEGFAPYYSEWWRFSFGDREWAKFYGKKRTLYTSTSLLPIEEMAFE